MNVLLTIPWFKLQPWHLFGPVKIQPFGVLVAIGILFGSRVAENFGETVGIKRKHTADFLLYTIVVGLMSAMVLNSALYEPEKFMGYFRGEVSYPGLSSFGGFFGGTLTAWWFRNTRRISILHMGSVFAYAFPFAWFFGRMGCFVVHDHPGIPTEFFLGVENYNERGITRHDLGLYEVIWSVAVAGLFMFLARTPQKPGFFLGLIGVLYAPIRFGLDYLRAGQEAGGDVRYGTFTPGQYWAILMLVVSIATLAYVARRPPQPLYIDGEPPDDDSDPEPADSQAPGARPSHGGSGGGKSKAKKAKRKKK